MPERGGGVIQCRRCGATNGNYRHHRIAHYHNVLLDGWFCAQCVDELIDNALANVPDASAASAVEDGSLKHP